MTMTDDRTPRALTRRQWLVRTAAGGVALGLGSALYAWRVEPHWVTIRRVTMPLRDLPENLVGKRLVQISDLHVGPVVDDRYLRGVLARLSELEPDYLVITGDFMTTQLDEQIEPTLDTLGEAPIQATPTLAVLGNHDYGRLFRSYAVADELAERLGDRGVHVLRNESVVIDGLQFVGFDDIWAGRCRIRDTVNRMDLDRPTVCLVHNPDAVDDRSHSRLSGWTLSGHTHGGQVHVPFLGPPILPVRNQRYAAGHIPLSGGRDLYVNRGLGYKRRIRFGVWPEVTLFELAAA